MNHPKPMDDSKLLSYYAPLDIFFNRCIIDPMKKNINLFETGILNINQYNVGFTSVFKKTSVFSVVIIMAVLFAFTSKVEKVNAADTGWIDASQFNGSVAFECGRNVASVYGSGGESFRIPGNVLNLPAGSYSIDIEAGYGYYWPNPNQSRQPNEDMRIKTFVDSKVVEDLNGTGGERADRDNCTQIM